MRSNTERYTIKWAHHRETRNEYAERESYGKEYILETIHTTNEGIHPTKQTPETVDKARRAVHPT